MFVFLGRVSRASVSARALCANSSTLKAARRSAGSRGGTRRPLPLELEEVVEVVEVVEEEEGEGEGDAGGDGIARETRARDGRGLRGGERV